MDDGTRAGLVDHRDVLTDAIIGFHLEAPPIGPHGRTRTIFGQLVGNLVALNGVVKGGDLVAKLLRHIHDLRHLIGAVAMHVHEDVAIQHTRERVQFEITRRWFTAFVLVLLPFALVFCSLDPSLPVPCHIAHPRIRGATRKTPAAIAIHALGILAAGHLQRIGRVRKFHALNGPARHVLEDHAAPAEQVCAAR